MSNSKTTLKKISDDFHNVYQNYSAERVRVIESACEKLVVLLESLKPHYHWTVCDDFDNELWINLRYECHVGIRYCGRFINYIKVHKDKSKPAIQRLSVGYAAYEDEVDDFEWANCYPDDTYFGEKAEQRYGEWGILEDWGNFENLLKSLKPFFAPVASTYEAMMVEIRNERKVMADLQDKIDYLNEELDLYLHYDILKTVKGYDKKSKKHFVLLPDNLSIRYKGRFHNCLTFDNYSHSLGYMQFKQFVAEEGYIQDPYTVGDDFDRYLPGDYKLLHEVALNSYNNGYDGFGRALRDLIFLCGENMERLKECKYLKGEDVEYKKNQFNIEYE